MRPDPSPGSFELSLSPPQRFWTARAILLVGALGGVYTISQFSRNAIGVVAPDLARELSLSAAEIGLLSSVFFLTFALAQIPLGVIIDRHGPKRVMLACFALTLAATGAVSLARNFTELLIGRALLGLGCSSFLIAPLVIYARTFPAERYSSLTGLQLAIGNFGTIAATAPLAIAAAALGWRGAFALVAIVALVGLVAVIAVVAPDRGGGESPATDAPRASLLDVTRVRAFWPMMAVHGTTYPTFAALAGLWGGPWLADVYGLKLDARGLVLLALVSAHIVGLFAWSAVDRRFGSYRKPLIAGGVLTVAALAFGALVPMPLWAVLVWLAVFGFAMGYAPLMMAHSRMLFPPHMLGRGLTLMNAGNMTAAFAIQAVTGLVVNAFPRAADGAYPAAAYATVMGLLGVQLALALVAYTRVPDLHPSRAAPTA